MAYICIISIYKTAWYWHESRHMVQWKRIESPKINSHSYGQLIFNKGGNNIQWEKDNLFSKWYWEYIYMCVCVCVCVSCSVVSDSLQPHGLYSQPARLFCPWDFPGKVTGMGCHFLLQGIFQTQGLNPSLLHCSRMLYHLSYLHTHTHTSHIFFIHSGFFTRGN